MLRILGASCFVFLIVVKNFTLKGFKCLTETADIAKLSSFPLLLCCLGNSTPYSNSFLCCFFLMVSLIALSFLVGWVIFD